MDNSNRNLIFILLFLPDFLIGRSEATSDVKIIEAAIKLFYVA